MLIWQNMDNQDKAIESGNLESVVYITGEIVRLAKILVKFQNDNFYKEKNMAGEITKDMVMRAKNYPFEKLIEVKRNNMASCPFHEDKTPSFSIKNNRGYCFSCHWKGDTIDFVTKKDGLSFADAVKKLC
jgi:hypothetical protein